MWMGVGLRGWRGLPKGHSPSSRVRFPEDSRRALFHPAASPPPPSPRLSGCGRGSGRGGARAPGRRPRGHITRRSLPLGRRRGCACAGQPRGGGERRAAGAGSRAVSARPRGREEAREQEGAAAGGQPPPPPPRGD